MSEKYKTIFSQSIGEFEDRRSKFMAYARPVKDEESAKDFIEEIKKKDFDARHHVFAYQIGHNNEIRRSFDDGEPSGTAGMPILEILEREELKFICIVCTRYFGGTLLGTGGLVRAYSGAAKNALDNGKIILKEQFLKATITIDYTLSGKLEYELLNNEYYVLDTKYSDKVQYEVCFAKSRKDNFISLINEHTNGQNNLLIDDKLIYAALINNNIEIFDY